MDKYEEILKTLINKLPDVKFALIGSLGLRFHGIKIDVKDIDLLTNNEGIKKIAEIFNSRIVEDVKNKCFETKSEIDGVEIHCVSDALNQLEATNFLRTQYQ
jgi:hypothetical protein